MKICCKVNYKILVWIYLIVYPILPSYTRMFGYTIYSLLTTLFCGVIFFLNINKIKTVSKNFFLVSGMIMILYSIPFFFHGEYERIVYEYIEVYLPITLLLFSFRFFSKEDLEYAISIIIFTSFVVCLSGILEFFTSFNIFSIIENTQYDNPRFGSIQATRLGVVRIEQSFNTALTYALYISMTFALTFYRFFAHKNKLYIIIMAVQVINILFTMTRGASLVFIGGMCMLFFFNRRYIGIKKIFLLFIIALLFFLVALLIFPDILSAIFEMLESALNLIFGGRTDIDESNLLRQRYQAIAFDELQNGEVLLFGVGEYGLRNFASIDNEWLLEITGYGIFGFLAFCMLLVVPVKAAFDGMIYSKDNNNKNGVFFFKCMLIMLFEYYVSLYTVAQMADAKMFYILFAVIVAYSRIVRREINSGFNCNSKL